MPIIGWIKRLFGSAETQAPLEAARPAVNALPPSLFDMNLAATLHANQTARGPEHFGARMRRFLGENHHEPGRHVLVAMRPSTRSRVGIMAAKPARRRIRGRATIQAASFLNK
jgi:hypothetical protein